MPEYRLQEIAARDALTPEQVLRESVDRLLDQEKDILLAVKRGDEDIANGRVLEHGEVVARVEKMLSLFPRLLIESVS